jgi:hypothetical protein
VANGSGRELPRAERERVASADATPSGGGGLWSSLRRPLKRKRRLSARAGAAPRVPAGGLAHCFSGVRILLFLSASLAGLAKPARVASLVRTVAHRTVGRRSDTLYPRMESVRVSDPSTENALSSRYSLCAHCWYVRSRYECPPRAPARVHSSSSGAAAAPGADSARPARQPPLGYPSRQYCGGRGKRCRAETGSVASAVWRPRNPHAATASRQWASPGRSRPVARTCVAKRCGRDPPGDFGAGDSLRTGAGTDRAGAVFSAGHTSRISGKGNAFERSAPPSAWMLGKPLSPNA